MRTEHVRRSNLSTVLRHVHAAPMTRSQLSETTGLTRTAIASLVASLVDGGLVREDDSAERVGPGRPSPVVSAAAAKVSVGIEIAADSIAATVVSLGGAVIRIERRPRMRDDALPVEVVRAAVALVRSLIDAADELDVLGVGVAVAGVVERAAGRVVVAPNIGWADVPLRELVVAAIDDRWPVEIANEADLGMLAECGRGAAIGRRDVVYISGEAGVGGGVLVDGNLLRGATGFAGELGHIPVNPKGARCRCGARGCWETEVGEAAVLRRAGRRRSGRGGRAIELLLQRANDGDALARAALRETGQWLGVGIAGLVNLLNPELVVLGGYFAAGFSHLQPTLETELDRRALTATRSSVAVVPAALGIDAALIGAAELGFGAVLADPVGSVRRVAS